MTGIAMGLHVCCGLEDNLWKQSRTKKGSAPHLPIAPR